MLLFRPTTSIHALSLFQKLLYCTIATNCLLSRPAFLYVISSLQASSLSACLLQRLVASPPVFCLVSRSAYSIGRSLYICHLFRPTAFQPAVSVGQKPLLLSSVKTSSASTCHLQDNLAASVSTFCTAQHPLHQPFLNSIGQQVLCLPFLLYQHLPAAFLLIFSTGTFCLNSLSASSLSNCLYNVMAGAFLRFLLPAFYLTGFCKVSSSLYLPTPTVFTLGLRSPSLSAYLLVSWLFTSLTAFLIVQQSHFLPSVQASSFSTCPPYVLSFLCCSIDRQSLHLFSSVGYQPHYLLFTLYGKCLIFEEQTRRHEPLLSTVNGKGVACVQPSTPQRDAPSSLSARWWGRPSSGTGQLTWAGASLQNRS